MLPANALIAELESRSERFEEEWSLPWSGSCHPESIWRNDLVRQLEASHLHVFDAVAAHLIAHSSFALQGIAVHLVAERGRTAFLDAVRDLMESPSLQVRALSAMAIGTLHDAEGLEILLDTKDSEHAEVKKAIVDALRAIGDTRCIPLLARWVGRVGEDDELRRKACCALGSIGDDAAMPVLARVLEDGTVADDVRHDAAVAIGRIGGQEALGLLRSGLLGGDPRVQAACLDAVEELQERTLLPAVLEVAANGDARARLRTATLLTRFAGPDVFRALSALVADEEPSVRRAACRALGRTSDPRVATTVLPLIEDGDPGVQLAALHVFTRARGLRLDLPDDGSSVEKEVLAAAVRRVQESAAEA